MLLKGSCACLLLSVGPAIVHGQAVCVMVLCVLLKKVCLSLLTPVRPT